MRQKIIEFNGYKYRLSGRYYRRNNYGSSGPSNLHRAIWEHHHGPIPSGHDIHHVDGDSFNNAIGNLQLIESREHVRRHTKQLIAEGKLKPPSEYARAKAAEWHGSPEGLAWHSENGKRAWDNRVLHDKHCEQCGRGFKTPYPNKTKFCHDNCKAAALRARRGRPVGTRPTRKVERPSRGMKAEEDITHGP